MLSLLAEVAEERPLVCLVDDAQWLDRASAQALAFVARRLLAESVGAGLRRARAEPDELAGLPELRGRGSRTTAMRGRCWSSVVPGPLDERVRDRIVAETRGNPLALLELPRGLTPAELAGGFGLPDALPLLGPDRGELPAPARARSRPRRGGCCWSRRPSRSATRRCCGARPSGSAIGADAAAPADDGGPARVRRAGARSAIRSCARRSTARPRRTSAASVHRALAEATDPSVDPDRRAWHRAQATAGPDEDVAAELERSAGRAQARGGLAAAAAFLERAAELTPDPARRAQRALAAAQAKHEAGAPDAALGLLATARGGTARRARARARVELLRAQIAFAVSRGSDAPPLLLEAAKRLEPLDADARARDLPRSVRRGALRRPPGRRRRRAGGGRGRACRAAGAAAAARRSDLLLDGLATLVHRGLCRGRAAAAGGR